MTLGKPGTQVAVLTRRGHTYFIAHVEGPPTLVNGRPIDSYFLTVQTRARAVAPLKISENAASLDIFCSVMGGGPAGQAEAVSLGLARALRTINPSRPTSI